MLNPNIRSVPAPKRPFSAISCSNPRRTSPLESISLPKHKKVQIEESSDDSGHKRASSIGHISPNLPTGESRDSSSDQSAAKWFQSKNENVEDSQDKIKEQETESPFYLGRQGSYNVPHNLRSQAGESFGKRARGEIENDELRGVIDDLTIENKKLKTVLRTWNSRSSPASSNPDRVFEVRMHGLPLEKKRELEQILRKFATGIEDPPARHTISLPREPSASSSGYTMEAGHKGLRNPTLADSGYATNSLSGLNAISQVGGSHPRDTEVVSKSKKESDIKNYLHDIPDSLFPREAVSVSDGAKMELIVERLEQLFTGKRATPGEHSLPMQQQQISRSAAKADRRESRKLNRLAKLEGSREAHIYPPDTKVNLDATEGQGQPPNNQSGLELSVNDGATLQTSDGSRSPDQRPTRPLDLDIHRAQIASENIQYLRHLGMSSPQFRDSVEVKEQPWLYLNLLVSMAQLHTLNVTPSFIRKALKRSSTQFELSKDGHKIRWIGGGNAPSASPYQPSPEPTMQRTTDDLVEDGLRSGHSNASTLNNASASISDDKAPRAQSSNASKLLTSTTASSVPAQAQTTTTQSRSASAFDYKPVVFQGKRTFLKANESYLDSASSYESTSPESSGLLPNALSRSSLRSKEEAYDGYVTFFNNPYFFTDLSGDKDAPAAHTSELSGNRNVLGDCNQWPSPIDDTIRDATACYYLTQRPPQHNSWPINGPLIEMPTGPIYYAGEEETMPIELDASGISGVRPEDNFALDVQIARKRCRIDPGKSKRRLGQKPTPIYGYEVEECDTLNLRPSRLPPPSYVFFRASSSSSADQKFRYEDEDSDSSSNAEDSPMPTGFLWQWSSNSDDRQAGDDDDISVASSSLGVLQAARARAPQASTINEMGRAGSGSLAATAGASWSAASNAPDFDIGGNVAAYAESVDSMSVAEDF